MPSRKGGTANESLRECVQQEHVIHPEDESHRAKHQRALPDPAPVPKLQEIHSGNRLYGRRCARVPADSRVQVHHLRTPSVAKADTSGSRLREGECRISKLATQ
jgi:hypothetical protein